MRLHLGEWAMTVAACMMGAAVALSVTACPPGTSVPPQVITSGVDLAVCVLTTASTDIAAGKSAAQVVIDCVQACGADAVSVGRILDAHHAAELREKAAAK